MKKQLSIASFVLVFAILFSAGCKESDEARIVNDQVQKANAALVQAEQEGVPQYAPKDYSAAKTDYNQALNQSQKKEYVKARASVVKFYADLESGRTKTVAAKAKEEARAAQERAAQEKAAQEKMLKEKEIALKAQAEKERLEKEKFAAEVAKKQEEARKKADADRTKEYAPKDAKLTAYVVKKNDWLSKIAMRKEYYNDKHAWPKIYDANRATIKNPNLIYPGQEVLIPTR